MGEQSCIIVRNKTQWLNNMEKGVTLNYCGELWQQVRVNC